MLAKFDYAELGKIRYQITKHKTKKGEYYNVQNIFCFDIEASNGYRDNNGVVHGSEYTCNRYPGETSEYEAMSLMYCWQVCLESQKGPLVFMGRTWEDFNRFLVRLTTCVQHQVQTNKMAGVYDTDVIKQSLTKNKRINFPMWIQNLSYEFQHVRNLYNEKLHVFARNFRKPMKADFTLNGTSIQMKDTYVLVQKSLKAWGEDENLTVKKLEEPKGYYDAIRTPETPLTENEINYSENDVLTMYYGLLKYRERFGTLEAIPMTQTGIIRKECKKVAEDDPNWASLCAEVTSQYTYERYNDLIEIYLGGYTHASAKYTNKLLRWARCRDFASSYPFVMATKKFPVSSFKQVFDYEPYLDQMKWYDEEPWRVHHTFYVDVTFTNVNVKRNNTFWSSSKARKEYDGKKVIRTHLQDAILDNGRIYSAKYLRCKMTDLDFHTFLQDYDCTYNINGMWVAEAEYLSTAMVQLILEHYKYKTELKGNEEKESVYKESKQFICSIYGVSVTKLVQDDIIFDPKDEADPWKIHEMTESEFDETMEKLGKSLDQYLTYQIGVWVTAWARHNLWELILKCDTHVAYCDTDSLKGNFSNRDEKVFRKYNTKVLTEEKYAAAYHNMNVSEWWPKDRHGNKRPLGLLEQETQCVEFKTLGAKRYAYQIWDVKKQKLVIKTTIAGLPKSAGPKMLRKVDDFRDGLKWCPWLSEKLASIYNDNQTEATWIDRDGNKYGSKDKFGVALKPIAFDMTMAGEYAMLVELIGGSEVWRMPEEFVQVCSIFRREVDRSKLK